MSLRLTIDGTPGAVPTSATLLDAGNRLGLALPQLCKDPDRPPLGACRTCLVHVEGQRGLPAACHLPARDGMIVDTQHPEAVKTRRAVLELTWSMLTPSGDPGSFGQRCEGDSLHSLRRPRAAPH